MLYTQHQSEIAITLYESPQSQDAAQNQDTANPAAATGSPAVPLTPAQQAIANAAANGGGSFVNSYVQNNEVVVVVVSVNVSGGVTDFSYFNASTGQPSSNNIGASLNPDAGANQDLGSYLAANPTIAGTRWINPYTPPPSN